MKLGILRGALTIVIATFANFIHTGNESHEIIEAVVKG